MTSEFFGVCASITAIFVYLAYIRQIARGVSIPNPATIFIWLVVQMMNAFTYFQVVSENMWKALIAIVITALMVLLFGYALLWGKFAKLGRVEIVVIIIATAVGVFWGTTSNATIANLLLQVIFVISYIPVLTGLWRNTLREKPFAWMLAVLAYTFATAAVLADYDGNWVTLAYPIINGIIGNGSVALSAFIINKRT